jgi:hypothetical protein
VVHEADRFIARWRLKTPHKNSTPFYIYGIGKKNGPVQDTKYREKRELIQVLTEMGVLWTKKEKSIRELVTQTKSSVMATKKAQPYLGYQPLEVI